MENQLLELLQGQLSPKMLDQLNQQIGGKSREQTAVAAKSIISTLLSGLSKNASTQDGASSLYNALEKDHDGSILSDTINMLTGTRSTQNQRMLNGEGIVNHILGDNKSNLLNMVTRMSGLDNNQSSSLMSMIAPIVMGVLGKTRKEQGLDVGGIASLLMNTMTQSSQQQSASSSLINMFLDQDKDGSVVDDVANIGMKMLGNFFRR